MSNIALLPVIIVLMLIIIFFIAFIVYSMIYKKKINKSLEQNESTAHIGMVPTESISKILIIIGVIAFAISIMLQLSSISSDVQDIRQFFLAEISDLSREVTELNEELEDENSIINLFDYSFGEIDTENHTVETAIKCIPKSADDDTVIKVIFGNEIIELEKSEGGIFSAVKPLPMFSLSENETVISITSASVTDTEIIENSLPEALYNECLPIIDCIDMLDITAENGKVSISGDFGWAVKAGEMKDKKLIFSIDGSLVKTIELTEQITEINESFEISDAGSFELTTEGVDSFGYTHRKVIFSTDGEYDGYDIILDKNGNILFG